MAARIGTDGKDVDQARAALRESLKLYNTLGRSVEPFRPLTDGVARVYTCGPTVYGEPHIGNMRTYIFSDVVRRVLAFAGYQVIDAMNITDVGHLTNDSDEGEDKVQKAALEARTTAWDIAEKYTRMFFEDTETLNILPKKYVVKATDHIPEMIELIRRLEATGITYRTDDGLYFDTSKDPDYGKLTPHFDRTELLGGRVPLGQKRNPTDFALWKFSKPGPARRDMEWDSPWGVGFPGWHIECSAMAMKYLGETLDIHVGGIDHIPIHHTNEIAQSETATGKPFARYWLHGAFLVLEDEHRMGKSEGNVITIKTLQEGGYAPLEFRYLVLLNHYRKPLSFSTRALDSASKAYRRLQKRIREFREATRGADAPPTAAGHAYMRCFVDALAEDLNMPKAIACTWNLVRDPDLDPGTKLALITVFDQVLGLDLRGGPVDSVTIPDHILELAARRQRYRDKGEYAQADVIRDQIAAAGYRIIDGEGGHRIVAARRRD